MELAATICDSFYVQFSSNSPLKISLFNHQQVWLCTVFWRRVTFCFVPEQYRISSQNQWTSPLWFCLRLCCSCTHRSIFEIDLICKCSYTLDLKQWDIITNSTNSKPYSKDSLKTLLLTTVDLLQCRYAAELSFLNVFATISVAKHSPGSACDLYGKRKYPVKNFNWKKSHIWLCM